ncbi:MAG TPA: hypothetical protein PK306_12645 [Aquabacterium sp.]|jgi:hypothetical protein|nr:hypothetical protein [Aquabacterium sp.]
MHLGIEKQTGSVFEGMNHPEVLVLPRPAVSLCKLIQKAEDWKQVPTGGLHQAVGQWIFREDSFDPVTRIRRGRLYQPYGIEQWSSVQVPRDASPGNLGSFGNRVTHVALEMYRYMACTALLAAPNQGRGLPLVLGTGAATSVFTVLQVETLVTGDLLVTLKAKTAFGVIPDLNAAVVPAGSLKPVQQALERAVNSAFRETPVSVVDQCRNAMCTVLGHYLATVEKADHLIGKELGQLAGRLENRGQEVCACAAHIVARMHSRGKSNEQHTRGVREPIDEDAEFAVHALGLVMREIGWAV